MLDSQWNAGRIEPSDMATAPPVVMLWFVTHEVPIGRLSWAAPVVPSNWLAVHLGVPFANPSMKAAQIAPF
ncbi:MAG TPA: hypothetical protein VLT33_31260, partial [Labilithrix sp.]|nr:hypothetical protein [Labilithrix sp.]